MLVLIYPFGPVGIRMSWEVKNIKSSKYIFSLQGTIRFSFIISRNDFNCLQFTMEMFIIKGVFPGRREDIPYNNLLYNLYLCRFYRWMFQQLKYSINYEFYCSIFPLLFTVIYSFYLWIVTIYQKSAIEELPFSSGIKEDRSKNRLYWIKKWDAHIPLLQPRRKHFEA